MFLLFSKEVLWYLGLKFWKNKQKSLSFSSYVKYDLVERSIIKDFRICLDLINFIKYLNCPDCQDSGLYCAEHRAEVEKILKEKENDI